MRLYDLTAAAALLSVSFAAQAATPGYITSVVAGTPDPNGKVPAFNAVPGAGTGNFAEATPQAILNHGSSYVFCITLQNANVSASTTWSYKITQKAGGMKTTVQHATVAKSVPLSGNGLYAYCLNSAAIPESVGAATLTGTVVYNTSPKATILLNVPIILN